MNDPFAPLLADGVIDEVRGRLKSGKEADVWLVDHGGQVVAAKVYKARHARSFRNNAGYKEGRQVRDTRTQRAIDRGSRFGQAAADEAWKAKEADALHALHAAGVRVPTPVLFYEGVLLMELVTDASGHPAPRLVDAPVPRERAAALYADLRSQVIRMLTCDLIHGDLSPYNVLLGASGPVIIDFPQVVGAAHNSQAESFFQRDLENLRRFFAALDPTLEARRSDAREIWRAYVRRELVPEFVPTGEAEQRPPPGRRAQPPPRPATGHRGTEHHRGSEGHRGSEHHRGSEGHRARSHPPPGGARPQHHGRRPGPPSPEVVVVVRPRIAAPAVHGAAPRRDAPATPAARDAGSAPRPHRRRRRRRHP